MFRTITVCWLFTLVACSPNSARRADVIVPPPTSVARATLASPSLTPSIAPVPTVTPLSATPEALPAVTYGYTYVRADGNRLARGRGALPAAEPLDIALAGVPRWIVAAPSGSGSIWVAVLEDGRVQAFRVIDRQVEPIAIQPEQIAPETPPLLIVDGDTPALLIAPPAQAAPLTHAVPLNDTGRMAFIEMSGDLVLWDSGEEARFAVGALPDARILVDEQARLLLLTGATTRYDHGVLGDAVEASSITLIETNPTPRVASIISIPAPAVVEGIAPIWADLTGDEAREIIVTISDAAQGAQVVVFDEAGERLFAGPAAGQNHRWRHQIAVAPFGPQGELELADVLTPHLGGITEFYRAADGALQVVAQARGYTAHRIGSRNLDSALAGDLEGDGTTELLVPNQGMTELGALRHTADGVAVLWTLPIGGELRANLATATLPGNRLAVGVGRADGVLRLWLP